MNTFSHHMWRSPLARIEWFGILFILLAPFIFAQNPQTQTAPIYAVNSKYTNGVAPGYAPTAGTGLNLLLGPGTANCSGTIDTYAGGTLALTASTTNYIYLNASSSCVPAVNTTGFIATNIPIATVVTGASSITSISDDRTFFTSSNVGSTAFSALTSGTNTSAAMLVGSGSSLGTTGGGTIAATTVPYSGLTGSVPTWNQNTTGTAANLSGTPALPNGTTATTQTVGDNTTKLATDAFVLANASSGTVTSFAAPFASWPTWLVPTVTNSTTTPSLAITASAIPYAALTPLSANQILGSLTAMTPSGISIPSCGGPTNALSWTSGTGFGCNTISGGVSSVSNSDGTLTISPTTGTVVAGLNLGHANTWTATIMAPSFTADGTGAGLLTAAEGTAPSGVASSDLLWGDSTTHRLKMNNNNGGALDLVGIATAGTSGHCLQLAANGIDLVDSGTTNCGGGGGMVYPGAGIPNSTGTAWGTSYSTTGSGNVVLSTSPTLVTPALGTPASGVLTNATGLPLTTGVTGILPVANGGTATATPSLVAGSNVTITGTWPNQTIAASGTPGAVLLAPSASQTIQAVGTTTIPLIVEPASGSTVDSFEVKNSSGSNQLRVDSFGHLDVTSGAINSSAGGLNISAAGNIVLNELTFGSAGFAATGTHAPAASEAFLGFSSGAALLAGIGANTTTIGNLTLEGLSSDGSLSDVYFNCVHSTGCTTPDPFKGTTGTFVSGSSSIAGLVTQGAGPSQGVIQFGTTNTLFNIQGGPDYLGMNFNTSGLFSFIANTTTAFTVNSTAATLFVPLTGTDGTFSGTVGAATVAVDTNTITSRAFLITNVTATNWNPITQTGDAVLTFDVNNASATGDFDIVPHTGASGGIRFDAAGNTMDFYGISTFHSAIVAPSFTSTVTTGTAPFSVTSTTVVPNLNVSQLLGNTWAIPGAIGSTTPNTIAGTTGNFSGIATEQIADGNDTNILLNVSAGAGTGATAVCTTGAHCTASSGTVTLTTGTSTGTGQIFNFEATHFSVAFMNCNVTFGFDNSTQHMYAVSLAEGFNVFSPVAPVASNVYTLTYSCGL